MEKEFKLDGKRFEKDKERFMKRYNEGMKMKKEFNLNEEIKKFKEDLSYALGKFNWGNSCLDAQAITILNEWAKNLDNIQEEFIKIIKEDMKGLKGEAALNLILKKRAGPKLS